jgi:hypothetical protein
MSAIVDFSVPPDPTPTVLEEGKLFFDFTNNQLLIGTGGGVRYATNIDHLLSSVLDQNEEHKTLSSKALYKILLNKVDLRHSNKFTGMNEFPYLKISTSAPSQKDIVVTIRMLEDYLSGLDLSGGGGGSNYTLPAATTATLGGIRVGDGLEINSEVLSVKIGTTLKFTADAGNTAFLDVKTATGSTLGVVKVGSGLSINGAGLLTADAQALTPATTTVLGGVIIKDGLSVDVSGNLSTHLRTFEIICTDYASLSPSSLSALTLPTGWAYVTGGGGSSDTTGLQLRYTNPNGTVIYPSSWSAMDFVASGGYYMNVVPTSSKNMKFKSFSADTTEFNFAQIGTTNSFKIYVNFLV